MLGTLLGAAIGNAIGKAYDDREKAIDEIRKQQQATIETEAVEVLPAAQGEAKPADETKDARDRSVFVAHVAAAEHFPSGVAQPTEAGRKVYEAIADSYRADNKRTVLIVGHTDSSGDAQSNQALSEARSKAIAQIFVSRGFSPENIYVQGAGEAEPVASNDTADGRALNRRVEIADGSSGKALANYKQMRTKALEKRQAQATQPASPAPSGKPTITPPAPPAQNEPLSLPSGTIDFGGVPLTEDKTGDLVAGKGQAAGGFSLFGKPAYAATQLPPFLSDHGLQGGAISNFADQSKSLFAPDDCAPGYFRQPFYARVEQHFISISPISLMSDWAIGEPAATEVYVNYDFRQKNVTPTATLKGQARGYELGDAYLYRWRAADNKNGLIGIEVLLPKIAESDLKGMTTITAPAKIYYMNKGKPYVRKTELQAKVANVNIKGVL